jgi:hypothetical protein
MTINHAELYNREAEQQRMAKDATTRLTRNMTVKKVPDHQRLTAWLTHT